jgi:hypothetical protein
LEDLQKMFPGEFDGIEEADWRELMNASGARNFTPRSSKRKKGGRPSRSLFGQGRINTSVTYRRVVLG